MDLHGRGIRSFESAIGLALALLMFAFKIGLKQLAWCVRETIKVTRLREVVLIANKLGLAL